MTAFHSHYEKCADCSTGVLVHHNGGHDVLCKSCKRNRKLQYMRDYNDRRIRQRNGGVYIVIKDPDPMGGFSKGASFTLEEHECMLQKNSYTPGTILQSARGGLWKVIQRESAQEIKKWYGV